MLSIIIFTVERSWSKMTSDFAHTIFDPEGKILMPDPDADAVDERDPRINKSFLKETLQRCVDIAEDFSFDGYPWKSTKIDPDSGDVVIKGKVLNNTKYTDHEKIVEFYKTNLSNKRVKQLNAENGEYIKECKFFANHLDSRKHALIFARCSTKPCKSCKDFRSRNPLPKKFHQQIGLPRREENGALFFVPEEDPTHPGHNKTYLQLLDELKKDKNKKFTPDEDLADEEKLRCVDKNCLHVFKNDTAGNRHYALVHEKTGKNVI